MTTEHTDESATAGGASATSSERRRRELARQDLDLPNGSLPGSEDDPYWLCNLFGEVKTDDLYRQADEMEHDARILREAADRIEGGDWLPEEAALFIAENALRGEQGTHGLVDDIPIDAEVENE